LNPYDPCIANCDIDDKQCTLAWYVDDNKISHVDTDVVTRIIDMIEERFGKMTVTRGDRHTFLGMDIFFPRDGTVEITMKDYLKEAIEESGLDITRTVATPANRELFEVNQPVRPLSQAQAEVFHSVVAKLLYVGIRARGDLLLTIIYLCTRISAPTVEDQRKLKRLLEYINGTIDMPYKLGADDLHKFRAWVDASYAVHPDMRSHTGGVISFGTGGLLCKSSKQKLNTKSSTEAELVWASDYLPNAIWTKFFMEAQGHHIRECILEQDNESAIKLEKNGRASSGPRTRHINIRYFFIKDRTAAENITIRHCRTLQMLADFFTKPFQGALFRLFRDVILGHLHISALTAALAAAAQERVGKGPACDVPTEQSTNKITVQDKKVSWADVAAGRVRESEPERRQGPNDPSQGKLILLEQSS